MHLMTSTPLALILSIVLTGAALAQKAPPRGKADGGVTAVRSGTSSVAMNGPATLTVRYSVSGPDTALGGMYCSALSLDLPGHGMSRDNPCAPGSQLGLASSSNFLIMGSTARETVQVPSGITQLASQRAQASGVNQWFFVRQFASGVYATTRLRLAGSVPHGPLTLTRVELAFREGGGRQAVAFVPRDTAPGPLSAHLNYQGSGLLKARWEVVQPGDPEPTALDLTPEANLTPTQRLQQQRYTTIGTVEILLSAGRRLTVDGPPPDTLPTHTPGRHLVLLRLEATRSNSLAARDMPDLEGGGAAFPLPVLTYYVTEQGRPATDPDAIGPVAPLQTLAPAPGSLWTDPGTLQLRWRAVEAAALYRVELTRATGERLFAARIQPQHNSYQLPIAQLSMGPGEVRWRVQALDRQGRTIAASGFSSFFLP